MDDDSYKRFPVIVALLQLACMALSLLLLWSFGDKEGKESWNALFAAAPLLLVYIAAPINLVAGIYYFIKYRKDKDVASKLVVALAWVTAILFFAFNK